ncbi:ATP-dependent endonuclease, partial [Acinetobacter baumannii]|nr:ATP-dependent endonuclease [Acinetobacter baumannii]
IKYHVICDTDKASILSIDESGNPCFDSGIQKTISDQHSYDKKQNNKNIGLLRTHSITFEPAHQSTDIPDFLRFVDSGDKSKPFNANLYWKDILKPNITHQD